jgi:hypothetical protein
MMIDWLYEIGDFWVFVIFGAVSFSCFIAAPYVGSRLHLTVPDKDRAGDVLRGQGMVMSLSIFILAFLLVQVTSNLRQTEEGVAKEAGQLNFLDRQLLRYGDPKVAELRPLLWEYTRAILQDEWPGLIHGMESGHTDQALRPLSQAIFLIEPQNSRQTAIFNEMLKSLDQLAESRDQRIAASQLSLPFEFWCLALAMFAIMVGLNTTLEPVFHQDLSIAAQGLAIALLAALVFVVDYPFRGSLSVAPTPIEQALTTMRART